MSKMINRVVLGTIASLSIGIVLLATVSLRAATETQNFNSESEAANAGWIGVDNRNPSYGTDFGFSNTNNANGASGAGEAGGVFPRRVAPHAFYGDISIGTVTLADRLEATGRVVFFQDNLDGGAKIGWFDTSDLSDSLPAFAGVSMAEGNRFQATLLLNNNTGSDGTLQVGAPGSISMPFSLLWDPTTRIMTATIGGLTNTTTALTDAQLAIGSTFNTFGIGTNFAGTNNPALQGRYFIDNLTYTSVNTPTVQLHVNRFSGETRIVGVGGTGSVALDGYTAGSNPDNPPLENVWVPANWISIADQNGGSWQETVSSQQQIAETNPSGSQAVTTNSVISLGNIYNTADTQRDISFSYSLAGDASQKVGSVIFDGGLRLRVDKSTGEVEIVNGEAVGIHFDGYVIQSPSSNLNTTTWNSLQNQSLADWEEIDSSNAATISELNLFSSSLASANGGSFNLGNVYTGGIDGAENLTFTFSLAGGQEVLQGVVEYLAAVQGDYNANGVVDAADYVVWRRRLGQTFQLPNEVPGVSPGMVTTADYDAWRARFGNTSGSGSGALAAVPEPMSASLLLSGVALAFLSAPRRRS